MKRCDICIEEDCKGKKDLHDCHCESCAHINVCNKVLYPTIRITTKCTQSCTHCCFSCSPKKNAMMSIKMAKEIKQFLSNNSIRCMAIMGGEFFCNPDWRSIFEILLPDMNTRLVTNGDWSNDVSVPKFLKQFNNLKVSISKDQWHTNKHVAQAIKMCEKYDLKHNSTSEEQDNKESIVPVGRAEDSYGIYGMFSCWCDSPDHKYSFLIDEQGKIYKCGFGMWDYAEVKDHVDGGFNKVFKKFNQKFYSTFISNCSRCSRAYIYKFPS